jgi:hypothetical protein
MSSHIIERAEMLSGQPAARVVYFDEVAYNPPGDKYVGQLPSDLDGAAAGDPLGQMTQTEQVAYTGTGPQTEVEGRCGDYSDLDPPRPEARGGPPLRQCVIEPAVSQRAGRGEELISVPTGRCPAIRCHSRRPSSARLTWQGPATPFCATRERP